LLLIFMDPQAPSGGTLCLLERLDIYCPGEGLGRSISFLFRGMFTAAWQANPAGFVALPILSVRIVQLLRRNFNFRFSTP
ncbi:MAG: DUF2752 domain-containing protein, partial [Balneolaceae bacterium]